MTLFLELFLMLALYYMYSIQSQMIRLVENQMNHLHDLNLLLVGEGDCESEDCEAEDRESECDCDCDEDDCDCDEDECDEDDDGPESVDDEQHSDKEEKDDDNSICATCNRDDEKCRCPNPYKLLSKKTQ